MRRTKNASFMLCAPEDWAMFSGFPWNRTPLTVLSDFGVEPTLKGTSQDASSKGLVRGPFQHALLLSSLTTIWFQTSTAHAEAVRHTQTALTLMCLRRKTGKVWLKPRPVWGATGAGANRPNRKVGLAGASSHSGPEGS